ncbi:MAG TPA: translation initiation factor IF-3 [Abditibacteriaceae bacterium]|jgi:translation initiation factor IF-3
MINERIRFPQVRVIDDQNAQLGVLNTRDALDIARDRDLDLIVVAPQAQPPVCRIMDYGKFKYEKSKREKEAHKKSASTEMKMVRLKPVTSEHDRDVLIRHCERFLRLGHKVRVICRFQGRQNAHPEIGREQLEKVSTSLVDVATIEGPIIKVGRDMNMNLAPKPGLKPLPKPVKDDGKQAKGAPEEHDEDAEFEALQQRMVEDEHGEADADDVLDASGDIANDADQADEVDAHGASNGVHSDASEPEAQSVPNS